MSRRIWALNERPGPHGQLEHVDIAVYASKVGVELHTESSLVLTPEDAYAFAKALHRAAGIVEVMQMNTLTEDLSPYRRGGARE